MFGHIFSNTKVPLLPKHPVPHKVDISDKTSQRPTLINRVDGRLSQVCSTQGHASERNEARALASHLIRKYDLKSLLIEEEEEISQSNENFERFLGQITTKDPALKFFEVNTRDELFRSDQQLTRLYNEVLGVEICVCKQPDVLKSVENLVRAYSYGYVSGFTSDGWAKKSGLRLGDKILSTGECHLASTTHEVLVSGLKSTRDITLAPLCFFHSAPTQYLIICTPLKSRQDIGLRVANEEHRSPEPVGV